MTDNKPNDCRPIKWDDNNTACKGTEAKTTLIGLPMVNNDTDKTPGCLEGLQAIKEWLDEVYPADIFGGETDIMTAVCQDAYHELNPGVRAVIAMRWAINIGMCGKTAEPAIFISRRKDDD